MPKTWPSGWRTCISRTLTVVKIAYDVVKMRVQLGEELKQARSARGLSLEGASGAAKISQGYLHKLEAGRVNNPSPRVLQRLSDVLGVPYRRLMELADYLVPEDSPIAGLPARSEETEPMAAEAHAPSPTNAELLRLLEAVRAELAELKTGQQQLTRALEQITQRAE
jgi:transcriptional regulator with XRE-family HTH domain